MSERQGGGIRIHIMGMRGDGREVPSCRSLMSVVVIEFWRSALMVSGMHYIGGFTSTDDIPHISLFTIIRHDMVMTHDVRCEFADPCVLIPMYG
jgi:hypothetical protein